MVPGELEFHILVYLARAGDRGGYGWAIKKWLDGDLGLHVRFTTLYRMLQRFEQQGLVASHPGAERSSGMPRKYYHLTPAGLAAVARLAPEADAAAARLQRSAARLAAAEAEAEAAAANASQLDGGGEPAPVIETTTRTTGTP